MGYSPESGDVIAYAGRVYDPEVRSKVPIAHRSVPDTEGTHSYTISQLGSDGEREAMKEVGAW